MSQCWFSFPCHFRIEIILSLSWITHGVQCRIQRGFGEFSRTPLEAQIISFSRENIEETVKSTPTSTVRTITGSDPITGSDLTSLVLIYFFPFSFLISNFICLYVLLNYQIRYYRCIHPYPTQRHSTNPATKVGYCSKGGKGVPG